MGPTSDLVNKVLGEVDQFAKDLHDSLEARNLSEIVDIVFVSDHGMTDTSHPEWIYIDDVLGDGFEKIEHEDGMLHMHCLRSQIHFLSSVQVGRQWV